MSMPNPREEAIWSILDKILPNSTEGSQPRDQYEKALRRLPIDLLEAINERLPEDETE